MTQEEVNELFKWIALNVSTSSPFLSPVKEYTVDAIGLLDKIAEIRGIDKIENGKQFNQIADAIAKEKRQNTT